MDILKKATDILGKYRYAALILLIGVILMLLPSGNKDPQPEQTELTASVSRDLDQELTEILSVMEGVGRVQVMLTQEAGELILYQTDQGASSLDTVIITNGDREESGLVQQVNPPRYRGAIIVCQGADSATVRLRIIEAVASVTGLSTDKICVLKMK